MSSALTQARRDAIVRCWCHIQLPNLCLEYVFSSMSRRCGSLVADAVAADPFPVLPQMIDVPSTGPAQKHLCHET